jgi:hypothetical protein
MLIALLLRMQHSSKSNNLIKKFLFIISGIVLSSLVSSYSFAEDVSLSWDVPTSGGVVDGYIVYWSTISGSYNDIDNMDATGTSLTITDLDAAYEYFFIVKAYNAAGEGPPSNEICWSKSTGLKTLAGANTTKAVSTNDATVSVSSGGGSGGGCFIATAAYGSPLESHVMVLRQFRDTYLMKTKLGRAFVQLYYKYSPPIADVIAKHYWMRVVVRWSLTPLVGLAYVNLHTSAGQKICIVLLIMMLTTYMTMARKKNRSRQAKLRWKIQY